MNEAHLHLLFNHFPITGLIIGVLCLLAAIVFKWEQVERVSLWVIVLCCMLSFPAYFSGEGAEEMIEDLPGISHDVIHEHEEKAEKFIWLTSALGLLSLFSYLGFLRRLSFRKMLSLSTALLGLITVFMSFQVGNSGGLIRHPEIQEGAKQSAEQPSESAEEK
jgi:uncharacterized membrane protein